MTRVFWFIMPNWLRRWLTGARYVYLLDFDRELVRSLAWETGSENLRSYVSISTLVGEISLRPDGTVTRPNGNSYFVEHWLPDDVEERTFMILQGAEGFDINGPKSKTWT